MTGWNAIKDRWYRLTDKVAAYPGTALTAFLAALVVTIAIMW